MADQEQTNAMANILGKLQAVQEGTFKKSTGTSGDEVDAMAEVLRKLQAATGDAAREMVAESATDPELGMALQTERTEDGVSVSRYDIRTEKKTVQEGLTKTFYHIVDNKSGKLIHKNLGLFETAMGIVKHKLFTKDDNKIQRILDLDQEYVGAMMETYGYKKRLTRLDENSVQYDVATAKYSNSKERLSAIKMKILKAL
jgi:hypothetical protein